ncbi:SIR2 family protein [Pseudomonas protegens]|uniref:SIR2 family NAD-dependent protein deacylase n=1 Tax=Pseudomonas protegens TaxID=380021 RepID=UPI0014729D3F|nr:SIR2 family protein [Pseudomonas protegens]MDS9873567.1 SIR2 family protein [Pseudomonas protegens]NMZ26078.1 SIR2 family protein [Pseudomonas protegens]NMZ84601.1 SIR2 family protein [Pseudomonas protegens]
MEIRYLDDANTDSFLKGLIAAGRSVPFIGTGFTRGERAKGNTVPDGKGWMEIMRAQIAQSKVTRKPSESRLKEYSFQELSDIYFGDDIVDLNIIKTTLDNNFSSVKITTPSKLSFLALPWLYIYTLNIDDGIEMAINGVKVVPYEPFARGPDRKYVYKLHGDVFTALKAQDRDDLKLIFGKIDYVRSITKNRHLIDSLKVDIAESNILFVGCSLTDELDVLHALIEQESSSKTDKPKRVYITSSPPDDYDTEKKLRDYQISDVIVCDYDSFYLKYTELSLELESEISPANIFEFKHNATKPFDKTQFLNYFLQVNWKGGDSSHLSVPRSIDSKLLESSTINPVTILTGPRFSGRTSALYRLLRHSTFKKPYFVSSESALTDDMLNELLRLKNSLIIFDTEALSFPQVRTVCHAQERLATTETTVILALNKNDLIAADSIKSNATITLSHKFQKEERDEINRILDKVGTSRLTAAGTILDNIYTVASSAVIIKLLGSSTSLQQRIDERIKLITKTKISKSEFGLIYMLAAQQKVFSIIYRSLLQREGYSATADTFIETFEKHWAPFIEKSQTDDAARKTTHSSFALTSNSQAWVLYAIRSLASRLGVKKSAELLVETVAAIKEHPNHYELFMFDVLNLVFSTTTPSGAKPNRALISEIYKLLAGVLSDEPNYWLQRAKSIYHDHEANDITSVLAAIEHANKAITETEKTVTVNAKLTRANLYGLLCKVDNYKTTDYFVGAINHYFEAMEDYHLNSKYLDDMIATNKAGKGYLRSVLTNIPESGVDILRLKDKVSHLRQRVGI